ncbi:response regulator [Paenibacillus qinlingensis]|uniref:response regulator n=1 Tax=Paenibacillus qinlingensis TaxID=1837343 RepID=UPI001565FB70|nr:response regulator [Paenibacillus qinlingensis]NQX57839.1 response regulator [Paenibacillus qinlingensis]
MYRVMLVDDEPLVRLALRELIDWDTYQCEIIAEASDGEEALRTLQRQEDVDLIMMDIQMPKMDGITCLERLGEIRMERNPVVIVLSAYSEYDYVRQAFLLGAVDYIVKSHMEPEPMNAVVAKAMDMLKDRMQQAEQEEREQRALQMKAREVTLTEHLRGGRLTSEAPVSPNDSGEQIIGCIQVSTSDESATFTIHMIRQVMEGYFSEVTILPMSAKEYVLMLFFGQEASQGRHSIRHRIAEGMDQLVSHFKQYVNQSVSIGISDFIQHRQEWRSAYEQARELAELRFFTQEGRVFFPEHARMNRSQLQSSGSEVWDRKVLLRCLELGQPWQGELDNGFAYWQSQHAKPLKDIQKMYQGFLWELGGLLHARGLDWKDVTELNTQPYEALLHMTRMTDVHLWLEKLVSHAAAQLDPRRIASRQSPRLIDKAKAYINTHYHEPFSLSDVSEWVGVSECHLSKQFTKETGENFIAYVTHVRIEKAIQLMWGGMKLFEIAEKVGYPNQGHFSRIFKKVTGQTPQQYRESSRLG